MAVSGGLTKRLIKLSAAILVATGALYCATFPSASLAADNSPASVAPATSSPANANAVANPYAGGTAPGDSTSPDANGAGTAPDPSPPVSYHYTPSVGVNGVPLGSVRDFLMEGVNDSSPLGFALRPDHRELNSGETISGLTIVSIKKGGPAAQAGLQTYHNRVKKAFEFASIAGSFFFPPAIVLAPLLDASRAGDHYDMIVGIDGYRVRDVLDFADCLRDVQPNQPIYLSVVRDGVRTQMQIKMPDIFSPE